MKADGDQSAAKFALASFLLVVVLFSLGDRFFCIKD
jgi:hypothetical protein